MRHTSRKEMKGRKNIKDTYTLMSIIQVATKPLHDLGGYVDGTRDSQQELEINRIKCITEIQQSKYTQLLVVHIRAYMITNFRESCN